MEKQAFSACYALSRGTGLFSAATSVPPPDHFHRRHSRSPVAFGTSHFKKIFEIGAEKRYFFFNFKLVM